MSTLLLRGGVIHVDAPDPTAPAPTAMAIDDGRIVWIGTDDQADAWADADRVLDVEGAWVAPSFVDSHLHLVQAGFRLTELDLHGSPSLGDTLDRLAAHAAIQSDGAVLLGQGWDETLWAEGRPPTADELERAAPGARVCLTRIDGHSSVISGGLAGAVPGLEGQVGYDPDGRAERDAHHAVRTVLAGLVGPDQRLLAATAATTALTAEGVTAFHENAAPHIGPEYEIDLVRQAASEAGLHATVYWGELGAFDAAQRLQVAGLAGDLNADGAVGSRTAAMHAPYLDRADHCGHAYLDAQQIAEHVSECTRRGLQAGFHCIGDAAMDAIAEGFRAAADDVGLEWLRAAGHRLEHVEMPSAEVIATLADCGVRASMQPMFDSLWGGPSQMYAERLGGRWRGMNPLASMADAGVGLAFGSDSPVTPIGPWAAVRAATRHHDPAQRLDLARALRAHTRGGWEAARITDAGVLAVGWRAELAVWDLPTGLGADRLPVLSEEAALPRLRLAVAGGRIVHEEDPR